VHTYCIALRNPTDSECRVRLGEFPDSERAFQLAELIAFELGIEADARWSGWTVEVRSLQGQRLFATPVGGEAPSLSGSSSPASSRPSALEPLFN
jgi:hypothetical protein